MKTIVRTRFAPSPTGFLHLGNVRTALFNYLHARNKNGQFVIRSEDTDRDRSREEFLGAALDDLRWLGLEWDAGPDKSDERGPYRQSKRDSIYSDYYADLEKDGRAYPCFCTQAELSVARKTQLAAGRAPRYPGTCRQLSQEQQQQKVLSGARPTLRFRVDSGADVEFADLVRGDQRMPREEIGDFIIRRSDGTPSFFFSNAVDDALMEITDVLRGEDHLTNTPRQLLLLEALQLPAPRYGHISLVIADDGSPLSKRHGSIGVREMAEQGYFPEALCNHLARLGHKFEDDAYLSPDELASGFSTSRLGRAPARHDPIQLHHWQREALHRQSEEVLWQWMQNAQTRSGQSLHERLTREHVPFVQLVKDNIGMPADAAHWADLLLDEPPRFEDGAKAVLALVAKSFIDVAVNALAPAPDSYKQWLETVKTQSGVTGKSLFRPLRAALTGATNGPELARVFEFLGVAGVRARLLAAAEHCCADDAPTA